MTDEDFSIVLDLLKRPPTPDHLTNFYEEDAPTIDIEPVPWSQIKPVVKPIATKSSPSGICVVHSSYEEGSGPLNNLQSPQVAEAEAGPAKKSKQNSNDEQKTRKFTRSDEILLIRGMMKHGQHAAWKRIYDETPGLHHILHSALKDRARSNRFKKIFERAQRDPTLLSCPYELCGAPNQFVYTEEA